MKTDKEQISALYDNDHNNYFITSGHYYLQDFCGQPSTHYSKSRMLLHDSFWACHHMTISVRHWLTCTGCRFAIGSSTN